MDQGENEVVSARLRHPPKSGIKFVFVQNGKLARKATPEDPIFKFYRNAFDDYWEGVEDCMKKRMGQ